MTRASLAPIVRSISVSWAPAEAFRCFTADFAKWWPAHTHSIGGRCVMRIVFECQVGGLIFEERQAPAWLRPRNSAGKRNRQEKEGSHVGAWRSQVPAG